MDFTTTYRTKDVMNGEGLLGLSLLRSGNPCAETGSNGSSRNFPTGGTKMPEGQLECQEIIHQQRYLICPNPRPLTRPGGDFYWFETSDTPDSSQTARPINQPIGCITQPDQHQQSTGLGRAAVIHPHTARLGQIPRAATAMSSSPPPAPASTGDTPTSGLPDEALAVEKNLRFWLVVAALAVTSLLVALEVTIVSTGTATMVAQLGGQSSYVWIPAAYLLAMTSLQPLFGQLANVFGRRWPFVLSICIFMLGSGICGGASNMAVLIAGRTVQGVGGAGVNVLAELIVCDMVPLRERGSIMAIVFGASALGPAVGPVIGGAIVERSTWRWIFYINLPLGAVGLGLALLFLRVRNDNKMGLAASLARIDWVGNAIFVAACTSTLIATTWAGTVYPWASGRVLAPLVVGLAGLVGFVVFEGSPRLAPNPMMPHRLFGNRTTLIVFFNTFLQGIVIIAVLAMVTVVLYFLPVYFQAVLLSSPGRAGVQLLPIVAL